MKSLLMGLAVVVAVAEVLADAPGRQMYPVAPDEVVRQVATDMAKAPDAWKGAPIVYYSVPAMSPNRYLSNVYPQDGVACGELQYVAAQNEYEPASAVFFPRRNVDRFVPRATDFKDGSGATIPAAAMDVKLMKIWAQAGSAWFGQQNDNLTRTLIPEMLLNDERMIYVDPVRMDNYVRYSNMDGSTTYQWLSANYSAFDYSFAGQASFALIEDAKTLQPAVLNKNEFKQYMFTLHVPQDAKPGVYRGGIVLNADGTDVGTVPVTIRVLPFELPPPVAYYNPKKGYYLALMGMNSGIDRITEGQIAHNVRNYYGFPRLDPLQPERTRADVEKAKKYGINLGPIFSSPIRAGIRMPAEPRGDQLTLLKYLERTVANTTALAKRELGRTDYYCYAIDEAGPFVVRQERRAWAVIHDGGGNVTVTTNPQDELLFSLDLAVFPGGPTLKRKGEVDKFHESHPDGLVTWYANPHCGPENPDYARRMYGVQAWKRNYDGSTNFIWWRNNWNDHAVTYQNMFRGINMVYAGRGQVFDTIPWEGVREGLDDVRYATYMRQLANEAIASGKGETVLLGRRVLSFLTYWDEEHDDMTAFRLECIRYILKLRQALGKGN